MKTVKQQHFIGERVLENTSPSDCTFPLLRIQKHVLKLGSHTEECAHSLSKTNSDRSSGEALFSLLENRVAAEMKNPLEISIISLLKSFQEKNNESSPEKEFQDTHYQFPVSILWEATIKLIVSILPPTVSFFSKKEVT